MPLLQGAGSFSKVTAPTGWPSASEAGPSKGAGPSTAAAASSREALPPRAPRPPPHVMEGPSVAHIASTAGGAGPATLSGQAVPGAEGAPGAPAASSHIPDVLSHHLESAIRLNAAIRARSGGAALVLVSLPAPQAALPAAAWMEVLELVLEGVGNGIFVRGYKQDIVAVNA